MLLTLSAESSDQLRQRYQWGIVLLAAAAFGGVAFQNQLWPMAKRAAVKFGNLTQEPAALFLGFVLAVLIFAWAALAIILGHPIIQI